MSLNKKDLVSLDPNSTMARAYLLMGRLHCSLLPVTSDGVYVGVLSIEDIERLIESYNQGIRAQKSLTVGYYMKGPVVTVEASQDFSEVIHLMLEANIQAVIVKEGDSTLGVLSKNNLLELFARECQNRHSTVLDSLRLLNQS